MGSVTAEPIPQRQLTYRNPARKWVEALPVGNGRMGAMVFGRIAQERIQFNEDTLWTGRPRSYVHPGAADTLPEIRRLLFAGDQKRAEQLASKAFMSQPLRQFAYQPFGDLELTFPGIPDEIGDREPNVRDYQRVLDLDSAVVRTSFRVGQTTHQRQVFASYPDRAIIVHLSVDQPGQLACRIRQSSPHADLHFESIDERTILMSGRVRDRVVRGKTITGHLRFASHLRCLHTDGQASTLDDVVQIRNASFATFALTAATSFVDYRDISADPIARSRGDLDRLRKQSLDSLLGTHLQDHRELYRRVSLRIGDQPQDFPSTDDRILASKERDDPSLAALLFDYGRYLLIASSRPGCQPANLQGVWNEELQPPWDSKHTTNINYEMNYWPAQRCRLGECLDPYFQTLDELVRSGSETAKVHYGARGWVVHHNFDLWRGTAPVNASNHGIWPTGSAWLCQPLWHRYETTQDREFLATRAYPIMRSAAEFYVDTLIEDPRSPNKFLISGPSNSPEQGGLVLGPTMDHQLIRSLFAHTIAAAEVLEVDVDFRAQLRAMRERIAPNQIGRLGQLQEWLEDVDDRQNRHRHVSHLWGLFPGDEITMDQPSLFAAAKQSLTMRGDGGTGWSLAWKINFWARLREGNRAHQLLANLLTLTGSDKTSYEGGGVYPNLFDAHPPFQIDGNFGATSGICEMVMQSHRTTDADTILIELLPALPDAWPSGSLHGIQARGGIVLDVDWNDGNLTSVTCTAQTERPFTVKCRNATRTLRLSVGESVSLNGSLAR